MPSHLKIGELYGEMLFYAAQNENRDLLLAHADRFAILGGLPESIRGQMRKNILNALDEYEKSQRGTDAD